MSKQILILTEAGDIHAYAVAHALRSRGHIAHLWHTPDFPHRQPETIRFDRRGGSIRVLGGELAVDDIDTVWNRRPGHRVDEDLLHPADVEFADKSCERFRQALFQLLAPQAFWVNDEQAVRRNNKIVQHAAAARVGLDMPASVYTNDPAEIRAFLRECGGRAIYKPLLARAWQLADDTVRAPYTALIDESKLVADELLQAVPGIYQQAVDKAYELRVTVMGGQLVTAQIRSQETEHGTLDWRKAQGEQGLQMAPYELPEDIGARCVALLEALGLVFGCCDFIVTPGGDYVFLEVNQAGQFLFVEHMTGQPVLDMVCDFLCQGRPDYRWRPPAAPLRFADVLPAAQAMRAASFDEHSRGPRFAYREADASARAEAHRG
ncbi:MAG: ATP-grasp ribosomal peptide maturase [Haliangiales bacterium]